MKNIIFYPAIVLSLLTGFYIGNKTYRISLVPNGAEGITIWTDGAMDKIVRLPDGTLQPIPVCEPIANKHR